MSEYYKFFQNKKCEYFPCHKGIPEEDFNCLFCYCPLYTLGKSCGGNCEFLENGVKSCMNCGFPHHRKNYDKITSRFQEIVDFMAASNKEDGSDEMIQAIYKALLPLMESYAYYSLNQDLKEVSFSHYAYGFVTLGNGMDELSELYLNHEQIQEAYIVDCISLMLLSKAYEEFAHVVEEQSGLYLTELSFLGDTYSLDLLPQIYEHLAPDTIQLTEGQMLRPLKTATLILHLDTEIHAAVKQLCNTCENCKNFSCPSRKASAPTLPHTYGVMQIFHVK